MRIYLLVLSVVLASALSMSQARRGLEIYGIDVEGGKSTLVVAPSGESLLIDTGNIGEAAQRDAGRILAAIEDAGLKQIDHLVTTHWHRDHIGGMALVASHTPVREFIDHGANVQPDPQVDAFLAETYPKLYSRARRSVAKPGDKIAISGLDVSIVASAGETIARPLSGMARPNPRCAALTPPRVNTTENSQSIGLHLTFGKFRAVDFGDLSKDKEFQLMCPNNRIGTVDLFMVSHHGQPGANSEVFVHTIQPRVAIMNNGARKGGQPVVMKTLYMAPGLEDLWQLHFSLLSGPEYAAPGLFTANVLDEPLTAKPVALPGPGETLPSPPPNNGMAYWIKVTAKEDGSFTVTNSRNGFSKTYEAR